MAKGVVIVGNASGIYNGCDLKSIKYHNGTGYTTAVENGSVVVLDSIIDAGKDVWKGVAATANNITADYFIIASPELKTDVENYSYDEFENAAGSIMRGYRARKGDEFGFSADALDLGGLTPDKTTNKYLVAEAQLKLAVSETGTYKLAELIDIVTIGGKTFYWYKWVA